MTDEGGPVYLRARFYDSATGQFLTRDPIEAITRSPYAYVDNDPLNATDPLGLGTYHDCGSESVWSEANGGCIYVGSTTPPVLTGPGYSATHTARESGKNCENGICHALAEAAGAVSPIPSNDLVQSPTMTEGLAYGTVSWGWKNVPGPIQAVLGAIDAFFRMLTSWDSNADGYTGTFAENCSPEGVPNFPQ